LKIPFALTIGPVGGVLEIIPYFGSAVGLILALLSALTGQPLQALWVTIYFAIIVELEGHIIEPAFYGRAIGMHPAAVLVALLAGLKAGGIVGVLFAVPVVVVSITFLEEIQAVTATTADHPRLGGWPFRTDDAR
jgi:predicted PurR-regulated permease PerM